MAGRPAARGRMLFFLSGGLGRRVVFCTFLIVMGGHFLCWSWQWTKKLGCCDTKNDVFPIFILPCVFFFLFLVSLFTIWFFFFLLLFYYYSTG
ncbi:hypothetical protein K440DRAFT_415956 [Wilcoxina mikolae CBS 423.85]|nr:hypothetical protein K440DRAFT_415956 [Wilcoxina mikolae CBS 423.85]